MRNPASTLCILFTASLLPLWAHALQTFNTGTRNGGQDFAYTYSTPEGASRALQFRLNLDDIRRGSAEFGRISTTDSHAHRLAAMQKVARGLEGPNLEIRLTPITNGIDIAMRGRGITQDVLNRHYQVLEEAGRKADAAFLTRNMYTVARSAGNTDFIRPDHAAIAKRYTSAMQPVAAAIMQQVPGGSQSPRAFINAALNWLQTIPYDTLDDRTTSNGAGFQTPYGLILGNMGDCDSKATALAALIRAAFPNVPLTMIYVPDHAFIGVGIQQTDADYALSTQHGIFVLADATGPRLSPLGQIDEETRNKLKRQSSKTELVPIR